MTDRIDTPRTPRALPKMREQEAAWREYAARTPNLNRKGVRRVEQHIGFQEGWQAVLALIDKENTMPEDTIWNPGPWDGRDPNLPSDDTIPVPRALIELVYRVCGGSPAVQELRGLLDPPKPPAPRLRVVDVDALGDHIENATPSAWGVYEHIAAQPDVPTVLDEAIDAEMQDTTASTNLPGRLKARIRAALGVTGD